MSEVGSSEEGMREDLAPTHNRRTDPRLLEILVCPLTKTPLRYDVLAQELISDASGLAFPSAKACRSCWSMRREKFKEPGDGKSCLA